ncbi:MAG: alpha/beta hydrolase [Anaerolineae bacterium]
MSIIPIHDTELYYIERGAGAPVLFIHGSMNDYRAWQAQIEVFAAHYHVIAYSRRFHYPNPLPSGVTTYAVIDHARDLAELIQALGVGPVHAICSSYGGCVALAAAVDHPELFRSLVLGEPPVLTWLSGAPGGEELLQAQGQRIAAAHEAFVRGDAERGVGIFMDSVLGAGTFERFPPWARARLMENAPVMQIETATPPEVYFPQLPRDAIRKLALPVLLLTGQFSPRMFHVVIDELAQTLPNHERETIPNASHAMHNMNAPFYNEKVLSFLERRGK